MSTFLSTSIRKETRGMTITIYILEREQPKETSNEENYESDQENTQYSRKR